MWTSISPRASFGCRTPHAGDTCPRTAKDPKIGVMVDDAMRAIEDDNKQLKGALPKVFGRAGLDPAVVTGLIDLILQHRVRGHASRTST